MQSVVLSGHQSEPHVTDDRGNHMQSAVLGGRQSEPRVQMRLPRTTSIREANHTAGCMHARARPECDLDDLACRELALDNIPKHLAKLCTAQR